MCEGALVFTENTNNCVLASSRLYLKLVCLDNVKQDFSSRNVGLMQVSQKCFPFFFKKNLHQIYYLLFDFSCCQLVCHQFQCCSLSRFTSFWKKCTCSTFALLEDYLSLAQSLIHHNSKVIAYFKSLHLFSTETFHHKHCFDSSPGFEWPTAPSCTKTELRENKIPVNK